MNKGTKKTQMRELLCHAINFLLKNNLISLNNPKNIPESRCETEIFGKKSVITWHEHNYDELRISIWWGYVGLDNTCNMKPLDYKENVMVTCSCWLERRAGKWVQGVNSELISMIYCSKSAINELMSVPSATICGYDKMVLFVFRIVI